MSPWLAMLLNDGPCRSVVAPAACGGAQSRHERQCRCCCCRPLPHIVRAAPLPLLDANFSLLTNVSSSRRLVTVLNAAAAFFRCPVAPVALARTRTTGTGTHTCTPPACPPSASRAPLRLDGDRQPLDGVRGRLQLWDGSQGERALKRGRERRGSERCRRGKRRLQAEA